MTEKKPFANTTVDTERTKAQIRKEVERWGGTAWRMAEDEETLQALIEFRIPRPEGAQLRVRMYLPLPDPDELRQVNRGAAGGMRDRTPAQLQQALAQETRRRWRAFFAAVKQRFVNVAEQIATLEREFYPDLVQPNGRTVRENTEAWFRYSLESGELPALPEPGRKGQQQ